MRGGGWGCASFLSVMPNMAPDIEPLDFAFQDVWLQVSDHTIVVIWVMKIFFAYHINCALYVYYYYYLSSTSDHQALDPGGQEVRVTPAVKESKKAVKDKKKMFSQVLKKLKIRRIVQEGVLTSCQQPGGQWTWVT